ncbi:MAG TPA: hypothetical protein VGZ71_14560 [Puia sp.]|nr:hypothetical protein [Puia sp.]
MKIECLIKNMDWRNNPSAFDYKLKEGDKPITLTCDSVREFEVAGYPRYVSKEVEVDSSLDFSGDLDEISTDRQPSWKIEKLFLKIIFEGPAILYSYEQPHLLRFFYQVGDVPVKQLIYKAYRIDENNFGYNKTFQIQLKESLSCGNPNTEKLDYSENDLRKYFISYASCKGYKIQEQPHKKKRDLFSMRLFSGVSYTSLQAQDFELLSFGESSTITKFDSKINPIAGVEFEYILPFNKNKWSIPLDIYSRSYKASGKDANGSAQAQYAAVESAMGIRYYSYLNDKKRIYLNALIVEDFKTKSNYQWKSTTPNFYPDSYTVKIKTTTPILAFGAGYSYDRISAELRYYFPRELFESTISFGSAFKSISLFVKYKIF